jgi:hypothetical protein
MLHPDPDAPRTPRSMLLTLLAAIVVFGGMFCAALDHDTAMVALPEPDRPSKVFDEAEPAPLFPAGLAVVSAPLR